MRPPRLAILVLLLVAAAAYSGDVRTLPAERGGQDLVGKPMPALSFDRTLRVQQNSRERTATLYRWWTDGCPFCEKSLPAIESLRTKYGDRGLRTVAVYHPKPPRRVADEAILAAADRLGYGGEVAVDEDWSELKKAYLDTGRRAATSVTIIVDASGTIRFVHPGTQFFPSDEPGEAQENEDSKLVEAAIVSLLGDGH